MYVHIWQVHIHTYVPLYTLKSYIFLRVLIYTYMYVGICIYTYMYEGICIYE